VDCLGAGQTVIGAFGVAGALGTAPVSCVTGIGCIANAVGGTISFDVGYAGAKQVVSGTPQSTFLNQGLQSLGMSPEAADIVAAGLGIGSAVTAIAGANKALDQAIALGKLSGGSYQTFATNGVKVTSEVLETPQAVALVKEIQAGNPGITTRDAIDYATGYIGSGTALPIAGIAAQGSNLVKAVPKGDRVSDFSGYWMSPQQAREIAIMTPEQAGRLLGLPAAQAANILKNGMDFYAITPKVGATPKIFVSNVAGTTQGAVTTPGGAQQVIVPNRSLWTAPLQVNPFTLIPRGRNAR
jgi:filamentous hemagglutinin